MSCKCNLPLVRAESVAVDTSTGVTTVTLPSGTTLASGDVINILLATVIPSGTDGTAVLITNGTESGNLMKRNGNYFRPLPLRSRTVLTAQYLDDPAHFQIIRVRGLCGCM